MKKMCVFALSRSVAEFGKPDAVIIPGTKSTIRDLQFMKETGLSERIIRFAEMAGS